MTCQRMGVAAVLVVGAYGTTAGAAPEAQTVAPTLSIQQWTIMNVAPPTGSSADEERLTVLAWVEPTRLGVRLRGAYSRTRVFVKTGKDAYVTILNVDPVGETTVLCPNRYQTDNKVRASRTVEIPTPGSGAQVVVGGTLGTELPKVIASTESVPLFEAMQLAEAGAFQRVRAEPQGRRAELGGGVQPDDPRRR